MVTYEEYQKQKQEREQQEAEMKKLREQEHFVNAWIARERQEQTDSGLLCPRCHNGTPGHKAAHYCPQCMLELQIVIEYMGYDTMHRALFRSVKPTKMMDV